MSLPPSIQHLLADGRLSAGHARALLGTPDRAYQEQLARRAVQEAWPVRAVEDAVRDRAGKSADTGNDPQVGTSTHAPTRARQLRPPGLLELEELLADRLSTRVVVQMGAKRGKVVVEFADLEDLERLYRVMCGVPGQPGASE
jgi:ParB family chromosome partitioning protein